MAILPLALACPPPWILLRTLFYNSSLYKSINDTINGKLCLCKNSPRVYQITSNKRSKIPPPKKTGDIYTCTTTSTDSHTHTPSPPTYTHTTSTTGCRLFEEDFLCRWFWRGAVSTETSNLLVFRDKTHTVPFSGMPSPSLSYTTSFRYCRERRRSML